LESDRVGRLRTAETFGSATVQPALSAVDPVRLRLAGCGSFNASRIFEAVRLSAAKAAGTDAPTKAAMRAAEAIPEVFQAADIVISVCRDAAQLTCRRSPRGEFTIPNRRPDQTISA
jgi:protein-tyrosine-phosphatase